MLGDSIPTVRIELQGMTQQVVAAFAVAHDELKEYAKAAITESLTQLRQGGLERSIIESVERGLSSLEESIRNIVEEEVVAYFETGPGKEFIKQAIIDRLRQR